MASAMSMLFGYVNYAMSMIWHFFETVWSAMSMLFGYVNYAMSMIWHFFEKEVNWANIKAGLLYAMKQGITGVRELIGLTYREVVLPMVDVIKWIGGHLVNAAKEFARLALDFLGDMGRKLLNLGSDVWTKVKPALQQVALVGGGILTYSVGTFLDRVPPFSLLPCSTTSKIYIVLVSFFVFMFGAQIDFARTLVSGFLNKAFSPLLYMDTRLESAIFKDWPNVPSPLKGAAAALGFDPSTYRPPC